jgi:hypothetical protein
MGESEKSMMTKKKLAKQKPGPGTRVKLLAGNVPAKKKNAALSLLLPLFVIPGFARNGTGSL